MLIGAKEIFVVYELSSIVSIITLVDNINNFFVEGTSVLCDIPELQKSTESNVVLKKAPNEEW